MANCHALTNDNLLKFWLKLRKILPYVYCLCKKWHSNLCSLKHPVQGLVSKYHLVSPLPDGRAALVLGGAGWDGLRAEVEVDSGVIMSSYYHVIMSPEVKVVMTRLHCQGQTLLPGSCRDIAFHKIIGNTQ